MGEEGEGTGDLPQPALSNEERAALLQKTIVHRFNATGKRQKELTEEQQQELKETFDVFDSDGSGALDDKEIKHVMKHIGYADLSKEAVMDLVLQVDEDGSGEIEFPEFVKMMTHVILARDPKTEILKAFNLFTQKEEADLITFEDLRAIADSVEEFFTDEELQDMVDEGDRSGKGGLDRDDFLRVMRRTGLF
mmetsp:Transcript_38499/g.106094  ORF Transcript_38499/g.106094 Transcript_38499/m.106094 type:complete len:193 (+) Transcript_38499:98-676(+)